jgi:hypothetical protein
MVERIKLVGNGDYLEDRITITDPKIYTGSFSKVAYFNRRPDLQYLEYVCTDNPRPEGKVKQKDVEEAGAKSRAAEPRR